MAKQYSTSWQQKTNAISGDDFPLILLEIDHYDLIDPIRIVNDRTLLVHNGNTFQAFAFNIALPDDPESGLPEAHLSIDNVGKELVQWLEIADWNKPVSCRIIQVLRSAPNTVEWEITTNLRNLSIDSRVVTATLGFENLLGVAGVRVYYTPQSAVGLF
jgi:hypothetical protein